MVLKSRATLLTQLSCANTNILPITSHDTTNVLPVITTLFSRARRIHKSPRRRKLRVKSAKLSDLMVKHRWALVVGNKGKVPSKILSKIPSKIQSYPMIPIQSDPIQPVQ